MRALTLVLLPLVVLLGLGCRTESGPERVLVLDYEAFGPPSAAHELLGMDWWQWEAHGHSRPRTYPIKVVVYAAIPKAEVEARYPVVPDKEQDFRYVTKEAALEYLDTTIAEDLVETLTEDLVETRKTIATFFK